MASIKNMRSAIKDSLEDLTEEELLAIYQVAKTFISAKDNEPSDEEDGDDEDTKPKRGRLKKAADEDEDENEDGDADDDDEEEEKPVKRVSSKKKDTKVSKKSENKSEKKSDKKPTKKVAAKSEKKPAKRAAPAHLTLENVEDISELSGKQVAEIVKDAGLNLKKAKVTGDAATRKLLTKIKDLSAKKKVSVFKKLADKNDVEIKFPRGRSSDEKQSRVAIVHLINAGHSPL